MNRLLLNFKMFLFLVLIFFSCDKEVSVSGPQNYEIGKSKFFIETEPKGAEIYIDDKNFGLFTPDTVKWLTQGEHKFTLKLEPFLDFSFTATVGEDFVNSMEYNFYTDAKNFGSLKFISSPVGCNIYLNDSLQNFKTPNFLYNLIPGQYKIKYSFPEHRSDSTLVFVYAGKQSAVNMSLADTSVWVTYNTENSFIPDNTINDICIDDDNNIWVGTWHKGILRNKNGAWERINAENSNLPGNIIHKIKKDKSNNLWVATYTGLAKISNGVIDQYTQLNSKLPNNFVSDIDFDSEGNIWIGTQNGLAKFDGTNNWTIYKTNNSDIPANFITSVLVDKNNEIWLGTNSFNTINFNKINLWKSYQSDKSTLGDMVDDLIVDKDNNLWVGLATSIKDGKFGGVFILEQDTLRELQFGLANKHINSFYLDDENIVWVGSRSGIIKAKSEDDFQLITANNTKGLPINDILCFNKDRNNNLWIGTNGRGLVKYKMWNE